MRKVLIVIPMLLLLSSIFIPGITDAEQETLVNRNETIPDGNYFVYRFTKTDDKKVKIHIEMEVTPSESVDIFILDEDNFDDYKNDESFNVIWSESGYDIDISKVLEDKKDYRIVVDNSRKGSYYAGTDVVADLKITAEDASIFTDIDGDFFFTGLCFIGLFGLLILVFIIIILYFLFIKEDESEKSKRPYMQQGPPQKYQGKQVIKKQTETEERTPKGQTKNCKYCGTKIDADSKFCKECGEEL